MNKLNTNIISENKFPFFSYLKKQNNPSLLEDIQKLIQKYNLSSSMLISAKK